MLYLAPEQEIFQPHPREARLVRILNISSALGTPVFLGVGLLARCFGVSDGLDHFLIVALFTATLTIPPYRRAWGFCSKDYSYELKLNLARVAAWSYFVMFGSLATIFFSKTSGAPLLDILPSIVYLHLALALFALCTLNYSTIWHASVKWRPFFFRLFLGAAAGILLL